MKKEKRARLEGKGWKVGGADDFLELTKEEAVFVDLKVALARSLKKRRQSRKWTQTQLANAIGSSQPRVAKMEAADSSVSIDLLIKALLAMGASKRDLAKTIAAPKARSAA
ncbi:MAG: helix-turn-helix domain-containing protein [Proteobacteria bacterium]|nr:helix-turn-helix domain-containing protein [Pseudomonadota bacterium]